MTQKIPQSVIDAAQGAAHDTGIPASVSIAQWALESAWGKKSPGNNCFGIKARKGEPTVIFPTHEVVHGQRIEVEAAFRKFDNLAQAFDAHAELISTAPIYHNAMKVLPDVDAFISLMAGHYGTDPEYANKIRAIMRDNDLMQYDEHPNGAIEPVAKVATQNA